MLQCIGIGQPPSNYSYWKGKEADFLVPRSAANKSLIICAQGGISWNVTAKTSTAFFGRGIAASFDDVQCQNGRHIILYQYKCMIYSTSTWESFLPSIVSTCDVCICVILQKVAVKCHIVLQKELLSCN